MSAIGLRPSQIFWDPPSLIQQVGLYPVGTTHLLLAQSPLGLCGLFLGKCPMRLIQDFDDRFWTSLSITFPRQPTEPAVGTGSAKLMADPWIWNADANGAPPLQASPPLPVVLEEIRKGIEDLLIADSAGDLAWSGPLHLSGTPFQQRVWQELIRIPRGQTISYSELARQLNCPSAVRAVAAACGANPVAVIVPCHRVIAKTGKLTGYRWGLELKQRLLQKEQALEPPD